MSEFFTVSEAIAGYLKALDAIQRTTPILGPYPAIPDFGQLLLERDGWIYRCIVAWSSSADARDRVEAERSCPAVKVFADLVRGTRAAEKSAPPPAEGKSGGGKGINVNRIKERAKERGDGGPVEHDPDAVADFIERCESLSAECDDLPDAADEFADSVREKMAGMAAWAESNGCYTGNMLAALENMEGGVARWQR